MKQQEILRAVDLELVKFGRKLEAHMHRELDRRLDNLTPCSVGIGQVVVQGSNLQECKATAEELHLKYGVPSKSRKEVSNDVR